jgi:hypothetical protein
VTFKFIPHRETRLGLQVRPPLPSLWLSVGYRLRTVWLSGFYKKEKSRNLDILLTEFVSW